MTAKNLSSTCALTVLSAVAALALTGCSALSGGADDAKRDESTGEITESAEATVFSLKVGDCIVTPDATQVESLPTVPCSEAHDGEIYAEKALEGESLPADADTQADQFCYDEFATFIGLPAEESTIAYQTMTPTEGSWDQGDRVIQCIAVSQDQMTSSLKGAGI